MISGSSKLFPGYMMSMNVFWTMFKSSTEEFISTVHTYILYVLILTFSRPLIHYVQYSSLNTPLYVYVCPLHIICTICHWYQVSFDTYISIYITLMMYAMGQP